MKERLHRLERLYVKDPIYFVTACTHNRRRLMDNPYTHESFRAFCHAGMEFGYCVGRYVLMPDHLHLFVAISPVAKVLFSRVKFGDQRSPLQESDAVAAVSDRRNGNDQRLTLQPLSEWMKALKGKLSAHWRTRQIPSPHWQKGFFDHILRSSESYSEKWQYVVSNPVRAGLVQDWEQWPYQGEFHRLEVR